MQIADKKIISSLCYESVRRESIIAYIIFIIATSGAQCSLEWIVLTIAQFRATIILESFDRVQ